VVDGTGAAATLASPSPGRSVTLIDDTHGDPMAYIVHDPALAEDPGLVRAVGTAARLSLENERLQAEVRAQLKDVRELSSRLVAASDAERRRVERDLHDGAQQRLVTLALRLQLARDAQGSAGEELARMLADASAELDAALSELRELARGIHPEILTRYGLAGAVTSLAQRATIPVDVSVAEGRCTPEVDSTAYFVVAECLTNIARYASASQAHVIATREGGRLHLTVEDDGAGGADPSRGSGLTGLRDRVVAVGGSFRVESSIGAGTTVAVDLPCG